MALLLHIDTALEKATVGLSRDGELLMELTNSVMQDHAGFVQPAIQKIITSLHIGLSDIDAVGVTSGPGSYTGLRVGMASAKGISYALGKPLLAVTTLELMMAAAVEIHPHFDLYAPMIDARRNEVFMALYTLPGEVIKAPHAVILSIDLFSEIQEDKQILCFGNGSSKFRALQVECDHIRFAQVQYKGSHFSQLLHNLFINNNFCDLAYTEPLYVKDFYFEKGHKKHN